MPTIYLTRHDKEKLTLVINEALRDGELQEEAVRALRSEISQAVEVDACEVPRDAITMNTRAILHIDKEDLDIVLVYPNEANWSEGRISVLSPIGTAILGYRQGDTVEWDVPSGKAEIKIKQVLFQPEVAGME